MVWSCIRTTIQKWKTLGQLYGFLELYLAWCVELTQIFHFVWILTGLHKLMVHNCDMLKLHDYLGE
jgi:hypothetical protein